MAKHRKASGGKEKKEKRKKKNAREKEREVETKEKEKRNRFLFDGLLGVTQQLHRMKGKLVTIFATML